MDWLEHWALSLGVFIPLAGAAVAVIVYQLAFTNFMVKVITTAP